MLDSNGKSVVSSFPHIGEHLVVPLVSVILIIKKKDLFDSIYVPNEEQKFTCSFLAILKNMVVPLGCLMFGEFLNFHVTSSLTSKINAWFLFLYTSNHSDPLFLALRIFNLKQNISYLTELKFGEKNTITQCDNSNEEHDTEFIQFQENSKKTGLVMFYDFCINDFPHTMALRMTYHYNIRLFFVNPLIVLLSKLVLVMFSWCTMHRDFFTRLFVEAFSQYVFTLVFLPSLVTLAYKLNYLYFFSNSSCSSHNAATLVANENTCSPRLLLEWAKIVLVVKFINSFHIFNTLHTDIGDHLDSHGHTQSHSYGFQIYDFLSDFIEFAIFVGLVWSILYFTLEFYKLITVEQKINMELDGLEEPPFLISKTPEYHMVNVFENKQDLNENNIQDFIGYIDDHDNDENNSSGDENIRNIKSQIIIHKTHELEILEPFSKKMDLNRKKYMINNNFSSLNNKSIILLKMELSTGGNINKNEKLLTLVYNNGTVYIFNLKLGRWLVKDFKLNIRSEIGHTDFQIRESFFKKTPKQDIQYILVDNHGEMHTITIWNTESHNKDVIRYTSNRISQIPIVYCCKMITERMNDRLIFSTTDGEIYVCQEIVNRPWKSRPLVVIDNTFNIIGTQLLTPRNLKMRFSSVTPTTSTKSTNTQKRYPVNSEIFNLSHFGFTFILNKSTFKGELVDVQTGTLIKTFDIDPNIILSSITNSGNTSFQIYSDMEPTFCKFCGSCAISKLCISYNVKGIPTTHSTPTKLMKTHVFKIDKKNKKFICLRVERDPREIRCLGLDSVIEKIYYNPLSNSIDNNTSTPLLLIRPTTSTDEHSRDEYTKIAGLITKNILPTQSSLRTRCRNNEEESLLLINTKTFKNTEYPIMRNYLTESPSTPPKNTKNHSLETHNNNNNNNLQVIIKPFIQTSRSSTRSSNSSSFLMVQNREGNKLSVVYSV